MPPLFMFIAGSRKRLSTHPPSTQEGVAVDVNCNSFPSVPGSKVSKTRRPSDASEADRVTPESGYDSHHESLEHESHGFRSSPKCFSSSSTGLSNYTFIRDGDFDIVWPNVLIFIVAHIAHAYSLYLLFTDHDVKMTKTWIFSYWVGLVGGLGITAGAHRLWSHKSYDARLPLRIFLMIGQCIAGQNSLYVWCRDHRVHHKFSETDGDPHNTNRGFFFAHVGWLLRKKHPELKRKSSSLFFDDLLDDPVVKFQKDFYPWLYLAFAVFLPAFAPVIFWQESMVRSLLIVYVSRYVTSLHSTWFVNSTAHMFGDRPYNLKIEPRENYWVSYGAFGEGYHNYHHTFPHDYSTSELGGKLNLTKRFIDTCALFGLAYNLRVAEKEKVDLRKLKTKNHLTALDDKNCTTNKTK